MNIPTKTFHLDPVKPIITEKDEIKTNTQPEIARPNKSHSNSIRCICQKIYS